MGPYEALEGFYKALHGLYKASWGFMKPYRKGFTRPSRQGFMRLVRLQRNTRKLGIICERRMRGNGSGGCAARMDTFQKA